MDSWSIESGNNCNFDQIQDFAISMSQDDKNQPSHKNDEMFNELPYNILSMWTGVSNTK